MELISVVFIIGMVGIWIKVIYKIDQLWLEKTGHLPDPLRVLKRSAGQRKSEITSEIS